MGRVVYAQQHTWLSFIPGPSWLSKVSTFFLMQLRTTCPRVGFFVSFSVGFSHSEHPLLIAAMYSIIETFFFFVCGQIRTWKSTVVKKEVQEGSQVTQSPCCLATSAARGKMSLSSLEKEWGKRISGLCIARVAPLTWPWHWLGVSHVPAWPARGSLYKWGRGKTGRTNAIDSVACDLLGLI